MALGERFTRSAVACEFFVFADFANSSRRRLLRPAVGFMDNRGSVGQELCVRLDGGADRHLNANTGRFPRRLGSITEADRPFLPRDGNPDVAIWRLGDDPFNRYRVNAGTVGGHIWFSNARRTFARGRPVANLRCQPYSH